MISTHTLSPRALKVVENYLHLPFHQKDVSCPYYNNRRGSMRAGLRVLIGKGTPEEIVDEVKLVSTKEKVNLIELPESEVKKYLVEHKIGVDCSGLAYSILNAESISEGFGSLARHLRFPHAKNIIRKVLARIRPSENSGVLSFAHEKNSREIDLSEAQPGDYIVMLYTGKDKTYNHIVTIYQTDYEDETLKTIHYVHSFAWPSDGKYNHGVRKGTIRVTDPKVPLKNALWNELGKTGNENFTQEKAKEAMYVSLRRLNWF